MPAATDIRAGAAYVELFLKDNRLRRGLLNASKRLRVFGASLTAMGTKMVAASAAILAPLVAATQTFGKMGADLDDMSQRTGMSVEALSELGYAAAMSGTDVETLERSIAKMQRSLGEATAGSETAAEAFSDLGLSVAQLQELSPDEQFMRIAERLSRIEDPARRVAVAMKVFGKSGAQLLPLLSDGAAGIDRLRQEARDFGLVISTEDAQAAAVLDDSLDLLWKTVKAGVFHVGAALAPTLTDLAGTISRLVARVVAWLKENRGLVVSIAKLAAIVGGVGIALIVAGTLFSALGAAAATLASLMSAAGTAIGLIATPLGLIVTLLTTAVAVWARFTQSGQATLGVLRSIGATFAQTFGGILEALHGGDLATAGRIALAGLRLAFLQGLASLSSAFSNQFGDLLGSLATDIAAGDLTSAWETAIGGMAALWDGFAEGIVAVFTTATRLILDQWERMTGRISDWILKNASQGGWLGKLLLAGTGGGLDQSRGLDPNVAERDRQREIRNKQSLLAQQREGLAAALAAGAGPDEIAEWQKAIADLEQQLKALGQPDDPLAAGQANARQQLSGTTAAIRAALEQLDRDAQARADESAGAFNNKIRNGTQQALDAVTAAQAELDRLIAQAGTVRNAKTDELKNRLAGIPSADEVPGGTIAGTFNTAAAALFAGGGSAAERTARNTDAIVKHTKNTADRLDKIGLKAGRD